jgi:hypothetical protein
MDEDKRETVSERQRLMSAAATPQGDPMPATPPATVEDMFVQTASGIRTDDGTMTLLGLTPHTIYFSDRPERIVGHLTTHRFLQWWSEGDDSFAADPPNAVLAWGEPGTDAPDEAVVVISEPAVTADGLRYHIEVLQGTPPAKAGPCVLFIDPLGRPLSPVSVAGVRRRDMRRERRRL